MQNFVDKKGKVESDRYILESGEDIEPMESYSAYKYLVLSCLEEFFKNKPKTIL